MKEHAMVRTVLSGVLLIGLGAALMYLATLDKSSSATQADRSTPGGAAGQVAAARGFGVVGRAGEPQRTDLEQRVARLEARLAEEAVERRQLQQQCDALAAQVALRDGGHGDAAVATASSEAPSTTETRADQSSDAAAVDYSKSAMERALAAAGLDTVTAADIKRRHDELAMNEMYLRDQATREHWIDTPRFADEMAALDAQRTSVRSDIGDEAYDRYLYALGQPNRVRVDDVMLQSPAAQAGLQTGDMIVRYGDARIFAPEELVAQTRDGTAGETVQLEVIRNGERLQVDVPRGPLGLRIAATQDTPPAS
jgi:hypothetical protein